VPLREVERELVDRSYYRQGASWEDDVHRGLRRSRTFAWIVAFICLLISLLSITTLVLVLPLKQFEPYVVEVDKTTGYLEIARALKPGGLASDEAVTTANIARYIRARETYDPHLLRQNFDLASLLSSGAASDDLVRDFSPSNPRSLDKIYGGDSEVSVTIKSVSFLNDQTASVRFLTQTKRSGQTSQNDWVAVLRFQYTSKPLRNEYRFDNPLGFQVVSYRRDQETVPVKQMGETGP
jgi:type IV secretion system protein VirB8